MKKQTDKKKGEGFKVFCICGSRNCEPDEDCPIHGFPNRQQCFYCGRFIKWNGRCKRCGFDWENAYEVEGKDE